VAVGSLLASLGMNQQNPPLDRPMIHSQTSREPDLRTTRHQSSRVTHHPRIHHQPPRATSCIRGEGSS